MTRHRSPRAERNTASWLSGVAVLAASCAPAPPGTTATDAGAPARRLAPPLLESPATGPAAATLPPDGDEPTWASRWQSGRLPNDAAAIVTAALAAEVGRLHAGHHLLVEGIDQPGPGAAVVTLLLFEDERLLHRVAVAVVVTSSGAAATGARWLLPAPRPEPAVDLLLEPVADPRLEVAARRALQAVGLGHLQFDGLAAGVEHWPLVALVRDGSGQAQQVWLRRSGDRLVVAGSDGGVEQQDGP